MVAKKEELEKLVYGEGNDGQSDGKYVKGTATEKKNADVEDTLSAAKTSTEIAQYIEKNKKLLTPVQINKLNAKQRELEKKEEAKAESEKFEQYVKSRGYKNGSKGLSPKILATLKRQYGG